ASDQATAGTYLVVVTNPPPGGGESNSAAFQVTNGPADQVSMIANAANAATDTTHWVTAVNPPFSGGTTYVIDVAFYADGTGTVRAINVQPSPGPITFAYTKLGPDSLLCSTNNIYFQNLSETQGGVSTANFSA